MTTLREQLEKLQKSVENSPKPQNPAFQLPPGFQMPQGPLPPPPQINGNVLAPPCSTNIMTDISKKYGKYILLLAAVGVVVFLYNRRQKMASAGVKKGQALMNPYGGMYQPHPPPMMPRPQPQQQTKVPVGPHSSQNSDPNFTAL